MCGSIQPLLHTSSWRSAQLARYKDRFSILHTRHCDRSYFKFQYLSNYVGLIIIRLWAVDIIIDFIVEQINAACLLVPNATEQSFEALNLMPVLHTLTLFSCYLHLCSKTIFIKSFILTKKTKCTKTSKFYWRLSLNGKILV
jgi:hypothetical protein